jgi:hypothetical protein
MSRFKLVFFVPVQDTSRILNHLFAKHPQTIGKIGQYENCAFVSQGTGQFKPGHETNPAIGTRGELEFVEENRVEVMIIDKGENEEVRNAIKELKAVRHNIPLANVRGLTAIFQVHPYEEVAYDIYRLENF